MEFVASQNSEFALGSLWYNFATRMKLDNKDHLTA